MEKAFGDWLREKLEETGISKSELARRGDLTKQNIGKIVNRVLTDTGKETQPGDVTVEKIAKGLGLPVGEVRLAAGIGRTIDADPAGIYEAIRQLPPPTRIIAVRAALSVIESMNPIPDTLKLSTHLTEDAIFKPIHAGNEKKPDDIKDKSRTERKN